MHALETHFVTKPINKFLPLLNIVFKRSKEYPYYLYGPKVITMRLKKQRSRWHISRKVWSEIRIERELNPRSLDFRSIALTAKLSRHTHTEQFATLVPIPNRYQSPHTHNLRRVYT